MPGKLGEACSLTVDGSDIITHQNFLREIVKNKKRRRALKKILHEAEIDQLRLLAKLVAVIILKKQNAPDELIQSLRGSHRKRTIRRLFGFRTRLRRLLGNPKELLESLRLVLPFLAAIVSCFVGVSSGQSIGEVAISAAQSAINTSTTKSENESAGAEN